jgi:exodeoxyribonuclease VII large subunit
VARAIAACGVPVISAVGHETDFTIADFVADLRAPTPSGAAELVVREKLAVVRSLVELHQRLQGAMASQLERSAERVAALARRRVLTEPARALREPMRRLDEARAGLHAAARARHRLFAHRLELATNALSSQHPLARISHGAAVLAQLRGRLVASATHRATHSRHRLGAAVGRLQSLSPLAVLGRGYSLTRRVPTGEVVRSAAALAVGDAIEVLLGEGALGARVTDVKERDDRHQV